MMYRLVVLPILAATTLVTGLIAAPHQVRAEERSSREVPISTPGSYGSDSNGATSDNTLSSTTSLLRGESADEE